MNEPIKLGEKVFAYPDRQIIVFMDEEKKIVDSLKLRKETFDELLKCCDKVFNETESQDQLHA